MKRSSDIIAAINQIIDVHDLMLEIKRAQPVAHLVPDIISELDDLQDAGDNLVDVKSIREISVLLNFLFNAKGEEYPTGSDDFAATVDLYHSIARCLSL